MKISQLIEKLSKLQNENGNLDLFDEDLYEIINLSLRLKEVEEPPKDYNMPKKWVTVISTR